MSALKNLLAIIKETGRGQEYLQWDYNLTKKKSFNSEGARSEMSLFNLELTWNNLHVYFCELYQCYLKMSILWHRPNCTSTHFFLVHGLEAAACEITGPEASGLLSLGTLTGINHLT
jgi:hypothetical protein